MSNKREVKSSDLIFTAHRALLGEIRPSMRCIYIDYDKEEDKISVDFYYDTPTTEEDKEYDVEGTIMAEMISDYPDTTWEDKSHVVPYPSRINHSGICVYSRYEKCPKSRDNL